jgi:hypothetical protein
MTLVADTPTIAPDRELEGEMKSEELEPPRIRCPSLRLVGPKRRQIVLRVRE